MSGDYTGHIAGKEVPESEHNFALMQCRGCAVQPTELRDS